MSGTISISQIITSLPNPHTFTDSGPPYTVWWTAQDGSGEPSLVITATGNDLNALTVHATSDPEAAVMDTATTKSSAGGGAENISATSTSPPSEPAETITDRPTADPDPSGRSSGTSTGALAGAAIGCLLGGLIIGALVTFLIARRIRRKQRESDERRQHLVPSVSDKLDSTRGPAPESSVNTTATSTDAQLANVLLDATPDKDLEMELRALGDLVRLHVDSNYHTQPVQLDPSILSHHLYDLGFPGDAAARVSTLCLDPRTRSTALVHIISAIALRSIDMRSPGAPSLLPSPVADLVNSAARPHGTDKEFPRALTKWRVLSAYLLHPHRAERTPLAPPEPATDHQVHQLVSALNAALSPFAAHGDAQISHLRAVLHDFARYGCLLLSQPSEWGLVYGVGLEGPERNQLGVRAGLQKLTRRDGRPYEAPQTVTYPETQAVA
ncbi:uncharacterized protein J7T54_008306 [Emericellopsis cladophorae]|uniref:Uncharacterized protein n=1 Tax=Emericellopsis cladophorae TaxID=2686198 RepID=A0A9P9XU63_9HYPO|nr:uncharacterized protein J7T54_008306 [Emericellopsis cladophorae]KAI6777668.1 hypothetical protein J7T54_008306 [Emericellopsis cladophorae]